MPDNPTPTAMPCALCGSDRTSRIFEKPFQGRVWYLARCSVCGLHFTDPHPTLSDIQGFYVGDYHARLREPGSSERIHLRKFSGYRKLILRSVKPGRSLDVGCATGLFVRLLADSGFQAEGIEANPLSAKWGSVHYGVPIRQGLFDPSSAIESTYDLVTLCDVLEHAPHPLDYLRGLRRVLKPMGHVFLTFPDICSLESRYLRLLSIASGRNWLWRTCHIPYHTWEFTPDTTRRMIREAGFELISFSRQPENDPFTGYLRYLELPPMLIQTAVLGSFFGTQMRVLLRKRD